MRLFAELNKDNGKGKEPADHHQGGDHRRSKAGIAECQEAKRNAHIAGVRVRATETGETCRSPIACVIPAVQKQRDEDRKTPCTKRNDEAGLPQSLPIAIGSEIKELCRQGQPDDKAVDFSRGIRPELAGFARNKSRENQRENRDDNTEYG